MPLEQCIDIVCVQRNINGIGISPGIFSTSELRMQLFFVIVLVIF